MSSTGRASVYRGKRALDLLLTSLSAPVWLPLLAVAAVLVRLRIGAPVFFRQQRAGLHGAAFEIIKLRSMTDARDANGALLPDAERLTPFGRMLRSTSLDELPELLNVLRGEMSLVGPRPLLHRYLPLYSTEHRRRHEVPPGLTGLAQVAGRNAVGWPDRLDKDVEYIERQSLWLDVRILARTITVLFDRRVVNAPGEATMTEFTGYDGAIAGSIRAGDR